VFKVCPGCRGEFQQWVERCPDCGEALVAAEAAPPPAARQELPPARELVCVERGDPRALHEVAARLAAEGVSCRIDAYPPGEPIRGPARRGAGVGPSFGLYVLAADEAEARRVRTEMVREALPDGAALGVEAGAELAACPACGEALAEGAQACAACGLEFPDAPEA
jgi:hypothetical protein